MRAPPRFCNPTLARSRFSLSLFRNVEWPGSCLGVGRDRPVLLRMAVCIAGGSAWSRTPKPNNPCHRARRSPAALTMAAGALSALAIATFGLDLISGERLSPNGACRPGRVPAPRCAH